MYSWTCSNLHTYYQKFGSTGGPPTGAKEKNDFSSWFGKVYSFCFLNNTSYDPWIASSAFFRKFAPVLFDFEMAPLISSNLTLCKYR